MLSLALTQLENDATTFKDSPTSEVAVINVDDHSSYVKSSNSIIVHQQTSLDSKPNLQSDELMAKSASENENLPLRLVLGSIDRIPTTDATERFMEELTPQGMMCTSPKSKSQTSLMPSKNNVLSEPIPSDLRSPSPSALSNGRLVITSPPLNDELRTISSEHDVKTVKKSVVTTPNSTSGLNEFTVALFNAPEFAVSPTAANDQAEVSKKKGALTRSHKKHVTPPRRLDTRLGVWLASVNYGTETQMSQSQKKKIALSPPGPGASTPSASAKGSPLSRSVKKKTTTPPTRSASITVCTQRLMREKLGSPLRRRHVNAESTKMLKRRRHSYSPTKARGNAEPTRMLSKRRILTPSSRTRARTESQRAIMNPEAAAPSATINNRTVTSSARVSDRVRGKPAHSNSRIEYLLVHMNSVGEKPSALTTVKNVDMLGEINANSRVLAASTGAKADYSPSPTPKKRAFLSSVNTKKASCTLQAQEQRALSLSVRTEKTVGSHLSTNTGHKKDPVLTQAVNLETVMLEKALEEIREMSLRAFDVSARNILRKSKKQIVAENGGLCSVQNRVLKLKGHPNSLNYPLISSRKTDPTRSSLSPRRRVPVAADPSQSRFFVLSCKGSNTVSVQTRGSHRQERTYAQTQAQVQGSPITTSSKTTINSTKKKNSSGISCDSKNYVNHQGYVGYRKQLLSESIARSDTERFQRGQLTSRPQSVRAFSSSLPERLLRKNLCRGSFLSYGSSTVRSTGASPLIHPMSTPQRIVEREDLSSKLALSERSGSMSSPHRRARSHTENAASSVRSVSLCLRGSAFCHGSSSAENTRMVSNSTISRLKGELPGYIHRATDSNGRSGNRYFLGQKSPPSHKNRSTLTGVFDWPIGWAAAVTRCHSSVRPRRVSPVRDISLDLQCFLPSPRSFVSSHFTSCDVNSVLECTAVKPTGLSCGSEEGLLPGDIILECNDRPMATIMSLQNSLEDALSNNAPYVMLRVLRGTANLVLREMILP